MSQFIAMLSLFAAATAPEQSMSVEDLVIAQEAEEQIEDQIALLEDGQDAIQEIVFDENECEDELGN